MEKKNIPQQHFKSLLAMLDVSHIPMFFLVPAINEQSIELYREYVELYAGLFPELKKMYPNFHYDDDVHLLRSEYYGDGAHFNEAGLNIETQRLDEKILMIEETYK